MYPLISGFYFKLVTVPYSELGGSVFLLQIVENYYLSKWLASWLVKKY